MDSISVHVTSPLTSSERKISTQWSLAHLRNRLYPITGIETTSQDLYLYPITNSNERKLLQSDNEELTTLEQLGVGPNMRIHVKDRTLLTSSNSLQEQLDPETVRDDESYRYVLPPEEYAKKTDSVMNWKKQNKLGRYDPNYEAKRQEQAAKAEEIAESLRVGQRCKLDQTDASDIVRIGTIRYVGPVPEIDNKVWCGVEFDEPLGKNDGSIKGVRYFESYPNYGSFVSPLVVQAGDFPIEQIQEEEEEDDEI